MLASDFRFLVLALLAAALIGAALRVPDQFFIFLTTLAGAVAAFNATSGKGPK